MCAQEKFSQNCFKHQYKWTCTIQHNKTTEKAHQSWISKLITSFIQLFVFPHLGQCQIMTNREVHMSLTSHVC